MRPTAPALARLVWALLSGSLRQAHRPVPERGVRAGQSQKVTSAWRPCGLIDALMFVKGVV